ncbi:MAG TPA: aspartate carbamoyltransferase catalytic subunit [Thermoanaerobaculia bacterium]|nr:aspartate carbamoyltransferase catalytic subunit [Thermoanaerobaculia bacterium]
MGFERRSLVGLAGLTAGELADLLDRAERLWEAAGSPAGGVHPPRPIAGLSAANLFLEPSTRTRCSFELAEARLGVERLSIDGQRLSLEKGETLIDTGRVLAAMGINVLVLRHPEDGAPAVLDEALSGVHVINAGDGANEHPTQALLDLLTLRRFWGEIAGRHVVMVGDVAHSRVVRSNYHGMTTLGAEVTFCGPQALLPSPDEYPLAHITDDLDAVLPDADAVMALRIQRERFSVGEEAPDPESYRRRFGVTVERVGRLADRVAILHPGPMNRGVEMDGEVADGLRALVLRQVTAGVAVRMAVLSAISEAR